MGLPASKFPFYFPHCLRHRRFPFLSAASFPVFSAWFAETNQRCSA